uniref:Ig-like domain-containing protein n=1 Tax=Denticeps clupeoides TaxID=299321 RepID=A0AAY4D145_9TELE
CSVSCPHSKLLSISGVTVVTQSPPDLTKTVFDCNIGREDSNYVSWYKQVPGEAPQFVLRFYHSHSSPDLYGTGFSSSRFTSKLASSLNYQLIISNVEVGDSAVYYCFSFFLSVLNVRRFLYGWRYEMTHCGIRQRNQAVCHG